MVVVVWFWIPVLKSSVRLKSISSLGRYWIKLSTIQIGACGGNLMTAAEMGKLFLTIAIFVFLVVSKYMFL